jgi:hypothetical protein
MSFSTLLRLGRNTLHLSMCVAKQKTVAEYERCVGYLAGGPLGSSDGCAGHREGTDPVTVWEQEIPEERRVKIRDAVFTTPSEDII